MRHALWLLVLLAGNAAAERVVTIGGDVTEIAYALGAGGELVARDSTSTRPAAAGALPDVGYMRQLNAEGILAMRPSLVLATAQAAPAGRGGRLLVLDDMALLGFGPATPAAVRQLRAAAEPAP